MVLPVQLSQVSDDGIFLPRRQVPSAGRFADAAFSTERGRDGCFCRVEACIWDVGPAGGEGRG